MRKRTLQVETLISQRVKFSCGLKARYKFIEQTGNLTSFSWVGKPENAQFLVKKSQVVGIELDRKVVIEHFLKVQTVQDLTHIESLGDDVCWAGESFIFDIGGNIICNPIRLQLPCSYFEPRDGDCCSKCFDQFAQMEKVKTILSSLPYLDLLDFKVEKQEEWLYDDPDQPTYGLNFLVKFKDSETYAEMLGLPKYLTKNYLEDLLARKINVQLGEENV